MSDEVILKYVTASKEVRRATAEAEELVTFLNHAAGLLKDWRGVRLTNTPPDGYFGDLSTGRGPSIDLKHWPDAKRLSDVLSRWHRANHILREANRALAAEDREVFPPLA